MVEFTEEETEVLIQGVLRIWSVIADDLLAVPALDGESLDNEGAVCSILDCSWRTYSEVPSDHPAVVKLRSMSFDLQVAWVVENLSLPLL